MNVNQGFSALRKMFSFPALLGVMLAAGACASTTWSGIMGGKLLTEADCWWHILVGERILSTASWPTTSLYSFTVPGAPWMASEWLGEVLMAVSVRAGGLTGLVIAFMGLSLLLMVLLYYYAWLRCGNSKAATAACAILLPLTTAFFMMRPQLLGWLFFLATLICLERFRQGRRKTVWFLPVIFLLWANTHPSFVFGLFAMGLYGGGGMLSFRRANLIAERWPAEQRRAFLRASLFCVLALLVTPYGTRLAMYPFDAALMQRLTISSNPEWHSMEFAISYGKIFFGLILLFLLTQVFTPPLTYRLEDLGLFLFAVYAASEHWRLTILFTLVFAPLLATLLVRWIPGYDASKDRYALNATLMALILAGLYWSFPSSRQLEEEVKREYPYGAVQYLRQTPVGPRVLNEIDWGGYLLYSLRPDYRVFIDGRRDPYEPSGVLDDYLQISSLGPQALPLLQKYDLDACLVRRGAPLATLVAALPQWELVYSDRISQLFVRRRDSASGLDNSGAAADAGGR